MEDNVMKKRIVCCIDDEETIPESIKEVVLRSPDLVHYYFLRVGCKDNPSAVINDPVDILAEISKGKQAFGASENPEEVRGLSIMAVANSIAQINKSKANIIFACDLSLDDVDYPIDSEECREFEQKLKHSRDAFYWKAPNIHAGLFLLGKLCENGFKYVVTSRHAIALESSDMEFWPPLDRLASNNSRDVAKMVERNFKREFGLGRTWLDLATKDPALLKRWHEELRAQPFRNGAHRLQELVESPLLVEDSAVRFCRELLDKLSVGDDDIYEAQLNLKMADPETRVLGIAKTIAVMRRCLITPDTYLFDLLDIVLRKRTHQVYLNKEEVELMEELKPLIHSDLVIPLNPGLVGVPELFDENPDTEFLWEHHVNIIEIPNAPAMKRYCYEVKVKPNAPKKVPINLSKLFHDGGDDGANGRRAVDTLRRLFCDQDLKMVIVDETFEDEIRTLQEQVSQGLFMLVRRAGDNYEMQLYARREFKVGVILV